MRESVVVKVPDFPGTRNRDKGKLFRLTEWSSARAEDWGVRMMFALGVGNDGQIPTSVAGIGMEGIAILGINIFLRASSAGTVAMPALVIPMLNELLECVKIIRDPAHPEVATDLVSDNDIEEVATRMWLRGEVLSLHLNFSVSAVLSALYRNIMTKSPQDSSASQTSPRELTP